MKEIDMRMALQVQVHQIRECFFRPISGQFAASD
jgi:hypothetical protein